MHKPIVKLDNKLSSIGRVVWSLDPFQWKYTNLYLVPHSSKVMATEKLFPSVKNNFINIIISAERRPLLNIGLPKVSSQLPNQCFSGPAGSRDFHQVIGPPRPHRGEPMYILSKLPFSVRGRNSKDSYQSSVCPARNVPNPYLILLNIANVKQ